MTVHEMLLKYTRDTGDLLTPIAITVAVINAADNWTEKHTQQYGTKIAQRIKEIARHLEDKET